MVTKHEASVAWQAMQVTETDPFQMTCRPSVDDVYIDPVPGASRKLEEDWGDLKITPFLKPCLLLSSRDHSWGFAYHLVSSWWPLHFYTQPRCSLSSTFTGPHALSTLPLGVRSDGSEMEPLTFLSTQNLLLIFKPRKIALPSPSCSSQEPNVTSWFLCIKKDG